MKQELIPTYDDPRDFMIEQEIKYPCNTQYMRYDGLLHRYFLTEEALNYYGIDVERKYISDSNNKTREFIEKVSKKIYDYIQYKSGFHNFQIQMYRIAIGKNGVVEDSYMFRKQFEECLVAEAKWLINNGDSAEYSFVNMEKGEVQGKKPEEDWRSNTDIALESQRALEFLGLDRWFNLANYVKLDTNKY